MTKGQSPAAELQQRLQQLSSAFAQRLQDELPALGRNAERLQHAADPQEQQQHLQTLRDQLHKLAGAAGTFGFSSLGQRARELEQEADQWLETLQQEQQSLQDFSRSLQQLARQQYDAALEGLLKLFIRNRSYSEGLPHKTLLQVFELLGNDHPLVTAYRRKLFAALY